MRLRRNGPSGGGVPGRLGGRRRLRSPGGRQGCFGPSSGSWHESRPGFRRAGWDAAIALGLHRAGKPGGVHVAAWRAWRENDFGGSRDARKARNVLGGGSSDPKLRRWAMLQVRLPPAVERWVREKVAEGLYLNESEVVSEALRVLRERETVRHAMLEELRHEVKLGLEDLDTGRVSEVDDEFFDRIRRRARERKAKRVRADFRIPLHGASATRAWARGPQFPGWAVCRVLPADRGHGGDCASDQRLS